MLFPIEALEARGQSPSEERLDMMAATFGTGEVLWSTFWFFVFFIWIMLLFHVFADIFRSPDLSGGAKAGWSIFVILLPYLGVFIYLVVRGDQMQAHQVAQAQAQEAALRAYIRDVADSPPPAS
jgi:hypothetical protein